LGPIPNPQSPIPNPQINILYLKEIFYLDLSKNFILIIINIHKNK